MENSKDSLLKPRKPIYAVLLSIAQPGLGHVYNGKLTKGLILFLLSFILTPVFMISLNHISSVLSVIAIILSIVAAVIIFFYAIVDSFILAKKTGGDYRLKEFNKWYIYLLFVIIGLSYPRGIELYSRNHIIAPYRIPTSSMFPSILKDDYIFVNKSIYTTNAPERGDIVVFNSPNQRHIDYIKRIVALAGDTIEVKNNVVFLNGSALKVSPVRDDSLSLIKNQLTGDVIVEENNGRHYKIMIEKDQRQVGNFEKTTIPNGYCFVLGDYRTNSMDSRFFGPIPLADVNGRAEFIYFPAETWKRFGKYRD